MKKKKFIKIVAIGLGLLLGLAYVFLLGAPIKRKLILGDCSAEYTFYLSGNWFCNSSTQVHCADNAFELANAKNRVAYCLCEKYIEKREGSDSLLLITSLRENPSALASYLALTESIDESTIDLSLVCAHKESLFAPLTIE